MIHWQTGEPPCGVRVLVEWMYRSGNPQIEVGVFSSPLRAMLCMSTNTVFTSDITILRWSTLDAAPDALGRLEKRLRGGGQYSIYARNESGRPPFVIYGDDRRTDRGEGTTLAAAIAELCGGTDDSR